MAHEMCEEHIYTMNEFPVGHDRLPNVDVHK